MRASRQDRIAGGRAQARTERTLEQAEQPERRLRNRKTHAGYGDPNMEKTFNYRFSRRTLYTTAAYLLLYFVLGIALYHLCEGGYPVSLHI